MKKIIICLVNLILLLMLVGCGIKKCHTCGEPLTDGGYSAFGNDYCNHCFLYDLGL